MKRAAEENRSSEAAAAKKAAKSANKVRLERITIKPEEVSPAEENTGEVLVMGELTEAQDLKRQLNHALEMVNTFKKQAATDKRVTGERLMEKDQELAGMRSELEKKSKSFDKLCDLARRDKEGLKARVDYLETLVDSKNHIAKDANKSSVEDELKKKVSDLEEELEESQLQAAQQRAEDSAKVAKAVRLLDEERKRSAELERKLSQVEGQVLQQQPPNEDELTEDGSQLLPTQPIADDFMGEPLFDENLNEDQMDHDGTSVPMEENSPNNRSLSEGDENEMMGEANDSIDEERERDTTSHRTSDTPRDSSETGGVEMRRKSSRISSRSEKKIDNKRRSDMDKTPSNSSTKGLRVSKINDTQLECPKCEYRTRSASAFMSHLLYKHSTNPRQLGIALLCGCGNESFSENHHLKCEISNISIVPKSATPKCVICEALPKTASGYARHLSKHHKTTPMQKGIFLLCSCGHEVRTFHYNAEHSKNCNSRDYTLHKVDDE